MQKKHLSGKARREALKKIRNRVLNGEEKRKIFDELSAEYVERDWLATMIARVPSREDGAAIKGANALLFGFICAWAGLKLFFNAVMFFFLARSEGRIVYLLPFFLFIPALAIWLALQVKKSDGVFYRIIGLLGIVGISQNVRELVEHTPSGGIEWLFSLVFLGLLIAITWLSFLIKRRYFPHIAYYGAKKDAVGYILDRQKGSIPGE